MFTRVVQRKRPRRSAAVTIALGVLVGIALIASSVLAALVSDSGSFSVIVPNKDNSSGLVDLGNAQIEYIGSSADNQSSGTGIFDPFVRLQGSPVEKGYNTDGPVALDTKSGTWTKAILANAIPVVDCDGNLPGTATCWELFVDINESNTAKYISLNEVEVWFTTNANLVGYVDPTGFPAGTATQVYDFTGEIKIHDVNQGSGRGDLRYLIPLENIDPFTSSTYFVLYSEWGTSAGASPDGKTWGSEGGFEEWKVRKTPNVSIVKTANPVGPVAAGDNIGFDITITNSGAEAATDVVITDPLPAGTNLNWSLDPAFTGCSITGAVGAQTLTCTFATLASGASIGPIHITSDTTDADCALVNNTATVTTGNDGGGSDSASVTVQCGALLILKQSTKTGNPAVATAGAEFCYSTTAGCSTTIVTDNGTGDEDTGTAGIGSVCVSGLTPGTYFVNETGAPPGYGGASQSDVQVTVVNGTNCTTSRPAAAATATFTNPPLADLLVRVDGQESGEIASSISCVDSSSTSIGSVGTVTPVDPAELDVDDLEPDTYTCTIVIDP